MGDDLIDVRQLDRLAGLPLDRGDLGPLGLGLGFPDA
jgi:hypothetical protein